MKRATVADLRNHFRRVSSWIEDGETVQIVKRGRPFALLTALPQNAEAHAPAKPDIMAQLKATWGDKVFSMEEVRAMREAEVSEDLG
jgi:antitoxin (DNA-binding transcriptional repressor) of toxin-antitoxin stability system